MTITEFETLNSEAPVGCMLTQGVCVAEQVTRLCHTFLFQLFSFYVEIHHDLTSSEVLGMRTLESTDEIDRYLRQVNISSLLA